jgi:rhamnosyl/mannosyltransferase
MSRILHIGKFFPPFAGGIENFLADLMPAQIKQGDSVAALVHDHQPRLARFFAAVQAEIWNNQTIYRAPSYGRLLYAPVSPQFPFWFNRVLQEFQPQILHLHMPNTSAFLALGLARAKHIPWVIHWHADVVSAVNKKLSMAYHIYRPFEQQLLAKAHTIIATSPPYLSTSVALQPWQDKCHIIPLGIASARLPEPTPEAQNWAEQQWNEENEKTVLNKKSPPPFCQSGERKKIRILSVGRLTYYKGHEILIRAMDHVENAQVFIVGQGELRQHLAALITDLKLESKVKLLGYCSDSELTALFATCDCFCLPSLERTEAFGVVLLEAMRYGKPIIASAIEGSGVPWVIQEAGILVPPQNITVLANTLQKIGNDLKWRTSLGEKGQQRFKQLFDIKIVSIQLSTLYQNILGHE